VPHTIIEASENWTPEQVDSAAQKARDLLLQHKLSSTGALPPIGPSSPEELAKNSFIEKLIHWLQSLFPKPKSAADGFSLEMLRNIAILFAALALLAVIAVLAIWIFRNFGRAKALETPSGPRNPFPRDAEGRLIKQIELAITENAWSRAARLRWRLFLLRRGLSPAQTPHEILHKAADTEPQYRAMFGPGTVSQKEYEICREILLRYESPK
jgi:hypothetical protein